MLFISSLIFPRHNGYWFIFYMYFQYYSIIKRSISYQLRTLSDGVIWKLIRNNYKACCDINNTVIVHPDTIYERDRILELTQKEDGVSRIVFVMSAACCEKNYVYISHTLFHNAIKTDFDIKLYTPLKEIKVAEEIELSLVSSPHDINNALIDTVIQNYFKLPKIIYKNDLIQIEVKHFAPANFYTDLRANTINKIYFKCNKVIVNKEETSEGCFCVIGETAIRQAPNIQSFLPRCITEPAKNVKMGKISISEVFFPFDLPKYTKIADAIEIFGDIDSPELKQLKPLFLIEGEDGCGDRMILSYIAEELGMHYFPVNNSDFTANVYAQYETKLNNIFFTAKMAAPCLMAIYSFQNFGKNNEGQYDQRLINAFVQNINNLFDKNSFPVIVVCCSNTKEISPDLRRVFLETFEIDAPTDMERELCLEWILKKNDILLKGVDLKNIANKTNGFHIEDLILMVYYSENNFYQNSPKAECVILENDNFQYAIDYMQSNYNESIGAPKVPKVQWSDVGGLTDVKEEIIQSINLPLKHPEMFNKSGLSRSGILLFGPPGTGKTLIAKAVATECNLCFLTVKGPELLNMYVGQSEQNIREVFNKARQASPCIIFFDELDSLAPNRGLSGDSGGVMDRVVSQLLAEMDGLDSNGKVFVIGATNRPDLIDPALLRPGRFDKLLYVGPCTDLQSKVSVLQALTRKFNLSDDVNLKNIVKSCPDNITGADFYGICANAWSLAAKRLVEAIEREGCDPNTITTEEAEVIVNSEDFLLSIRDAEPSVSKEDLIYFKNLKKELGCNK